MFLFQIVLVPFVDGNMEITVTKSSYQEKTTEFVCVQAVTNHLLCHLADHDYKIPLIVRCT